MVFQSVFCLVTILLGINSDNNLDVLKQGFQKIRPCEKTNEIEYYSEAVGSEDGELNIYLTMNKYLEKDSTINITFAVDNYPYNISSSHLFYFFRHDTLNIKMLSSEEKLLLRLKTLNRNIPIIERLFINGDEKCREYENITKRYTISEKEIANRFNPNNNLLPNPVPLRKPENQICGIRKVKNTVLITEGSDANPGDWPWHVALHMLNMTTANFIYICGGTLISKNIVLTAAQCVTQENSILPKENFRVILGKYSLTGAGDRTQEKKILKIIIHPKYRYIYLKNDIALLRLDSPVQYNDYVQPACIWKPELSVHFPLYSEIPGTVVGWGYTLNRELSVKLQQANVPRVSVIKCVKSNSTFYGNVLNSNNFCIGWNNGTSPCNGDSGGGFHVSVPDSTIPNAPNRWHVQGIISQGAALGNTIFCDPKQYVIATDLEKFFDWINDNLNKHST